MMDEQLNQKSKGNQKFLLVAEPSLHSAAVLAETCLERGLDFDIVFVIGPFARNKGDRDSDHPPVATNEENACKIISTSEAQGEITSIICQLENIGRVIYVCGEGDPLSGFSPHQFTSTSSEANDLISLEIAPSLFVTGFCADGRTKSSENEAHVISAALSSLSALDDASETESALIFLTARNNYETNYVATDSVPSCLLQVFRHSRDLLVKPTFSTTKDLPFSLKLRSLWADGAFCTCCVNLKSSQSNDDAPSTATKLRWQVSNIREQYIDPSRFRLLPVEL